jgi:hypothetical protein
MSEPRGQEARPPIQPLPAPTDPTPTDTAPPVSVAPTPDAPLFDQPRMESVKAGRGPQDVKALDRSKR